MDTTMCPTLEENAQVNRLAFLALPAKRSAQQVTGSANDLFQAIQTILGQIMADVCAKRTAEEFVAARREYFPQYLQVMMALSRLVSAVVSKGVIDRLSYESMSEMEADFRDHARASFGKDICDQALFTIFTLRKIRDLADRIRTSEEPAENLKVADQELVENFVTHIVYCRFHLDCLNTSIRTGRTIYPEVLDCISDGLRSLVNAYAYIRQATDLRLPAGEEELIHIEFDDEEQELVALSMRDVELHA